MRFCGLSVVTLSVFLWAIALNAHEAFAQYQPPSEKLLMSGKSATTWTEDPTDIVTLEGPVEIVLDTATLTAKQAVLWITADPTRPQTKRVTVALIGDAKVKQGEATRSGQRMMVTAEVGGKIQLRAEERFDQVGRDSALYRLADSMRNPPAGPAVPPAPGPAAVGPPPVVQPSQPAALPGLPPPAQPGPRQPAPPIAAGLPPTGVEPIRPPGIEPIPGTGQPRTGPDRFAPLAPGGPYASTGPSTRPTTGPSTTQAALAPTLSGIEQPPGHLDIQSEQSESKLTEDGQVVVVLTKGVVLTQRRANFDLIELQATRAVLFTNLNSLKSGTSSDSDERVSNSVTGVYLEGDVRIDFTPASGRETEQRMTAERVYYEFATDRAVLTQAVVQTVTPVTQMPITIRAKLMKQLSNGEFKAEKAQLSTSSFAVPSYAIAAKKMYVRQDPAADGLAENTLFQAQGVTFRVFDTPGFYLPSAGGSMSNDQAALRSISFGNSSAFGWHAGGEFGLFETLGLQSPRGLDMSFRTDYYGDRGPAGGLDARYKGGFITENTNEPWSFEGELQSYFVNDKGNDDVGRPLPAREDTTPRGTVLYQHQHFLPDGWQFQLRAGYVSDQEFLEQWFGREFDQDLPHDVSAYLKHQKDNEAYTLLFQIQPNDQVTTAELFQEQFEVEHIPELTYHRIGDSLLNDKLTFFTDDSFAGLHFQKTHATLFDEGFVNGISPGIPSLGTTGFTDHTVYRGDFRQEVDMPLQAGNFKVVPYVVGRYTAYSDSPGGDAQNRLLAGAGARISTAFWKTDDTVQSDMFDLHRMRHVIEPEVNLFTSASTVDRGDVFIYEERNDPINDISAAQIALHQRWQTYRGGPGRWRSVDVFTLNIEANFFANQPTKAQLDPYDFRGLYYSSMPEASVPRNSVNVDASWRIADNTILLADLSQNLDEENLATASVGLIVRKGEHLLYFFGNRYIADLNSVITTFAMSYELSSKYKVEFVQEFDFGQSQNVGSEIGIVRRFDSFSIAFKAFRDETNDQSGVGVNIFPNGLGVGLDSGQVGSIIGSRR